MISSVFRAIRVYGVWLLFLLPLRSEAAANVLIWPIDPILTAENTATELWVENLGTEPTTMQVRVIGWQQINGRESYAAQQQDVVASPPIVRIAGGKKQLIRLIRQIAIPQGKETAYRILIDEIPTSATPAAGAGVKLQMRYSVPLFAYGTGVRVKAGSATPVSLDPAQLAWRLTSLDGRPAIEISNRGPIHARLSNVTLNNQPLGNGLLGYVLADSSRIWPLPGTLSNPQHLSAQVNAEKTLWQTTAQR